MVTVQAPEPLHAPDHAVKDEPASAVAASDTTAPESKVALQVAPQEIASGFDVTVPLPVPARETVSAKVFFVKVADTDFAASMVTLQAPVPLQAPVQPANEEVASAAAVSATELPASK